MQKVRDIVDFHVHSYMSDGACSPREVIEFAVAKKIRAIALTDHDSIEGIGEAQQAALEHHIEFLQGIEISTYYENGRLLHIIGLGLDSTNQYFIKSYNKIKKAREARLNEIFATLKTKGIHLDYHILEKYAVTECLDRYTILKYFTQNKLCTNIQDVWDVHLDPIPYGDDEMLSVEEALYVIKQAGGLSFLAHYNKKIGLFGFSAAEMEKHVKHLKEMGLNGIERYYPSYNEQDSKYAEYLIHKFDLIPSGGTDFHGANRPAIQLGVGAGNFFVPYSVYENIKVKLNGQ